MALSIGFLGAGKMAQALAKGFVSAGMVKSENVIAGCPKSDTYFLEEMRREVPDCKTTHNNLEVVEHSDVVVIATKPPIVPKVLQEINPAISPSRNLMLSIALGIPIRNLEQMMPRKSRVIRVMPNTPALVQSGCTVYSCGSATREDDGAVANKLFSAVGFVEEVPEVLIDAVTGLSASGPAYIYMIIEALADGGVKMGIPRQLAYKLASHTVLGGAEMVLKTGQHPGALKDDVCSPAGCTIQALYYLERSGLRGALIEAVEAATLKSKETGRRE